MVLHSKHFYPSVAEDFQTYSSQILQYGLFCPKEEGMWFIGTAWEANMQL
jgi:hypothetical protein